MGGFSRYRSTGLLGAQVIRLLVVLTLLFASAANAGNLALKLPSGIGKGSTGYVVKPGFASNDGVYSKGLTSEINGKPVTVPASWRMASNAGQFAMSAFRLNPSALVVGAVATYLIDQGLQYIDGQRGWEAKKETSTQLYEYSCTSGCGYNTARVSSQAAVISIITNHFNSWAGSPVFVDQSLISSLPNGQLDYLYTFSGTRVPSFSVTVTAYPVPGESKTEWKPAEESDFNKVAAKPLPDDVAKELADKGLAIPVAQPVIDPRPIEIPLSDPYTKPASNGQPAKRVQDVAKVSPQPSTPEVAKVEVTERELGPGDAPLKDPVTNDPSTPDNTDKDTTDPCIENPDRVACLEKGEPEETELDKDNKGSSISPISVGGAGSCPADKIVSLTGGRSVSVSFAPICQMATMVNPVVLAVAWLAAGFILMGALRNE